MRRLTLLLAVPQTDGASESGRVPAGRNSQIGPCGHILDQPIDTIRAELAWVNEPVDPNVCGCRHLLCCEQTSHAVGRCPRKPTEKMWSFGSISARTAGRIISAGIGFEVI
jgi:hypothetical protein